MIYLLVLVLLFVGIFAIPFDFIISSRSEKNQLTRLEVHWFFGLLKFRQFGKKEKESEKKKSKAWQKVKNSRFWLKFLKNESVRKRLWQYFIDLLKTLHIVEGRLHIRCGLGDPADTGFFVGSLQAAQFVCLDSTSQHFFITPVYEEEVLEWRGHTKIRIYLLELIVRVLSIGFSLTLWKGIYRARQAT